jgi:hypothetical protein
MLVDALAHTKRECVGNVRLWTMLKKQSVEYASNCAEAPKTCKSALRQI